MTDNTRFGLATGAVLIVAVLAIAAVGLGAAAVQSYDITTDDSSNESIDVSLDFAATTDATVALDNSNGTTIDSTTLSGTTGDTLSTTLDPANATAGETLNLSITATDEANVTVNSTSLTKAVGGLNVTNATTDTLAVDVGFNSSTTANATLTVTDGTGATVLTDTISYDPSNYVDSSATLSREYNDTDGLTADSNLTAEVTIDDPTAYDSAYAQVEEPTTTGGGLFGGGDILGQDPVVALAGVLVIGGAYKYAREEDMI